MLLGLTVACRNPLDGVDLRAHAPIATGIIDIQLYDPAGNSLPKSSQVTLIGPDASKIVTILSTTKYSVNADGLLRLAVLPSLAPSRERPIQFTLVIEADGYLTIVQPIIVTSRNRLTRTLRWIDPARPPRTLAAGRIYKNTGADGATSGPVALLTPSPPQSTDKASVLLDPGVRLLDRDGKPVAGPITLTTLYTNARELTTSQVPGGGTLSNVRSRDSKADPGTCRVLSMAGSVTLESYSAAYRLAYSSSQPMVCYMDLNPATINAQTGHPVQPGDSIPLYSYDAVTRQWQQEKASMVTRSLAGRLEYQVSVDRFLTYVAAWTEPVCTDDSASSGSRQPADCR
jgi:hypothetical protein